MWMRELLTITDNDEAVFKWNIDIVRDVPYVWQHLCITPDPNRPWKTQILEKIDQIEMQSDGSIYSIVRKNISLPFLLPSWSIYYSWINDDDIDLTIIYGNRCNQHLSTQRRQTHHRPTQHTQTQHRFLKNSSLVTGVLSMLSLFVMIGHAIKFIVNWPSKCVALLLKAFQRYTVSLFGYGQLAGNFRRYIIVEPVLFIFK